MSRDVLLGLMLFKIVLGVTFLSAFWLYITQAPTTHTEQTVVVEQGQTVDGIASQLQQNGVIQSSLALQILFRTTHNSQDIKAGTYNFPEPQSLFSVADTLVEGQFNNDLVSITLIDGETAVQYTDSVTAALPHIQPDVWASSTAQLEGRLFPETYHVPATYTEKELITLLTETHEKTVNELRASASSTLSNDELVILASIVEREANTPESMKMVAGILLNRLAIGMPLQADATIAYALDNPLYELAPGELAESLREVDSPYNTYLYTALPPTPIANPGREALAAVISPTPSDYLFYITGTDGEFYYAETYSQHLLNIERHLR